MSGRRVSRLRKQTVEPVFGIIKQVLGFRRFLLRGHEKVSLEWWLVSSRYKPITSSKFSKDPDPRELRLRLLYQILQVLRSRWGASEDILNGEQRGNRLPAVDAADGLAE